MQERFTEARLPASHRFLSEHASPAGDLHAIAVLLLVLAAFYPFTRERVALSILPVWQYQL